MKSQQNIRCPACHGTVIPTALHCDACDITITGRFGGNEFAALAEDDLHFLRIFILCEGRIRDMESALGVSYPTIKTRLAKLKETLAKETAANASASVESQASSATAPSVPPPLSPSAAVLQDLESGRLTFDQAMAKLKLLQKEQPI